MAANRSGLSPDMVEAELEKILASERIAQSDALARLLRHVVTVTLAGESARIKEYTLGVEVFRRGEDFDPRVDTIVRAQARRLRAKLVEYYAAEGQGSPIRIELPKGTYVPVFRVAPEPSVASLPESGPARFTSAAAVLLAAVLGAVVLLRLWQPPRTTIAGGNGRTDAIREEAYLPYIKSRLSTKSSDSMAYLDQALRADPGFGPAWLAKAELLMSQMYRAAAPPVQILPRAREAARRAIAAGHDVPAAHRILAIIDGTLDWDWDAAERGARRAMELAGDSSWERMVYAQMLARRGRTAEASQQIARLGALDSPASVLASVVASIHFFSRRYDKTIEHCRAVMEASPDGQDCEFWMGRALLEKGQVSEAVAALEKKRPARGQGFGSLAAAYLAAGRRDDALRLRAEVERLAGHSYVSPVSMAQMYFAFGEREIAFVWLDRALEVRDQSLPTLAVEPAYDAVRGDPRFQSILRKVRL